MTYKVGPKGQVVLPKQIREQLGIQPGDHVTVDRDGDEVRIRRVPDLFALRGILRGETSLTAALEREHRAEIASDEREWRARLGDGGT